MKDTVAFKGLVPPQTSALFSCNPASGPVTCRCCPTGPHLKFEDEVSALQPHVDKLHKLGVNKIIALGHSGFTTDKKIAKEVRGVDIVIGGHSNTFLYTGRSSIQLSILLLAVTQSTPGCVH